MMKDPVLNNALRLAQRKKYGAAIILLESEILRYRESYRFYYILSLCCLYTGDYGRAYTYFKSANDLKPNDANVVLGIAALNVKRGESGRALDLYLKVLEADTNNRIAKKALAILRKYAGSDELLLWIESGKIKQLFPRFPKSTISITKLLVYALSILAALAGIVFFTAVRRGSINPDIWTKEQREGFASSALPGDDRKNLVELGGAYQSILSENQVLEYFEKARSLFNNYDDNRARVEINRIMRSNASQGVKNKARILLRYMDENIMGFNTLKTNFSWREVQENPPLYNACYIIWKGMATNILAENERSSFDFLVGYENKTTLLGMVRVICPFAAVINSEQPLEVLARIQLLPDTSSGGASFSLEGAALHQILPGRD